MNTECPACGCDDTYLCSAASQQGTVRGLQTAFAERAGPPATALRGSIVFLVGSLLFLWATYSPLVSQGGAPGFIKDGAWILFLVCGVAALFALKRHSGHKERLARWRKSWICTRCGKIFIPEEGPAVMPAEGT